jgi:hypothetical protein
MLRTMSFGQEPALQPALWLRSVTTLAIALSALRESLTASRRYQRSRSSGVSHDAAIRDAFDIGATCSGPIHFAGRM